MAFQLKIEKVLISDNLDNCCLEILTKSGIEVKAETKFSKEELLAEIPVSKIVWEMLKACFNVLECVLNNYIDDGLLTYKYSGMLQIQWNVKYLIVI